MIELYCKLIITKHRTFNSIPDKDKPAVEARLKEKGYDTAGNLLDGGVKNVV